MCLCDGEENGGGDTFFDIKVTFQKPFGIHIATMRERAGLLTFTFVGAKLENVVLKIKAISVCYFYVTHLLFCFLIVTIISFGSRRNQRVR